MRKLTDETKIEFLSRIRGGASVTTAAKDIGVSRRAIYDERDRDLDFRQLWDHAVEESVDILVDEVRARALDREDRDSVRLLMFLIKGMREQFKETYKSKPIQIEHVRTVEFSDSEMDEAMKILQDARVRGKGIESRKEPTEDAVPVRVQS
jgi:hypothetical protein